MSKKVQNNKSWIHHFTQNKQTCILEAKVGGTGIEF